MHPVLKPALGRVWRDENTLQIGLEPSRAVLLTCDGPATSRLIASMDGLRDRSQVIAHARHLRIPPVEAAGMLDALAAHGVLEDARSARRALHGLHPSERRRLQPDIASLSLTDAALDGGARTMARRRRANVAVDGLNRLGAVVTTLLAASGVGRLTVADPAVATEADAAPGGLAPTDAGRPRTEAVRDAVRALTSSSASCEPAEDQGPPPDVAVIICDGDGRRTAASSERLVEAGTPHLHAQIVEGVGRVGPFVVPGATSCARCHELHRVGCEPRRGRPQVSVAPVPACDSVLTVAVAAQAAFQVLAHLDGGRPTSVDGTLEFTVPTGTPRRRTWTPHPECECRRRARPFDPAPA